MKFNNKTAVNPASVTVIVLAHNQEQIISEALKGIMAQQCDFPVKIIVHNDCSTDNTLIEIYKNLADSPFPYSVFSPSINQYQFGVGFFYNLMFDATTKYIAICDGDDVWTDPTKLQKQVSMLEKYSEMQICHHRFEVVNLNSGESLYEWPPNEFRKNLLPGTDLARENFIGTLSIVFRRKSLPHQVLGYSKLGTGDYGLWGVIAKNKPIGYIDECMAKYRLHDNQMYSNKDSAEKMQIINDSRLFVANNSTGKVSEIWKNSIQ
jgi:glycosyltransferase involved in cell wall biosynthesis